LSGARWQAPKKATTGPRNMHGTKFICGAKRPAGGKKGPRIPQLQDAITGLQCLGFVTRANVKLIPPLSSEEPMDSGCAARGVGTHLLLMAASQPR